MGKNVGAKMTRALHTENLSLENRPPAGEEDIFVFPPSIAQQGFWLLDQLEPGNPAYNIAVRFRLEGPLDTHLLERALNEIVRRHEVLRTTFDAVDGEPMQAVHPSMTVPISVLDLRPMDGQERDAEEERLTLEEARRRFDLSAGPLLRAQALQLGDQEYVFLVTVHHIVSDGCSIGIITNELGAIYEAFSQGLEAPLPELPIQYADFAHWQQESLDGPRMVAQLAYWKRKLGNPSGFDVPTDYPRAPHRSFNGNILSRLLPRSLTERLADFSAQEKSTFFMTSLAALKILMLHRSGLPDVQVGTLLAGRDRVETEPVIGPFINTVVLRTDLSGDPTFVELLARVRETVLEAMANRDVPFERLVQALSPKRALNRHPMFDVNFIFQRDFVRPLKFAGIALTAIPSRSPGAIYDLNFFMVERADGWRLSCEYDTDLFAAASVDRMLWQLQMLMEGVEANPALKTSQLRVLMEQERRKVARDASKRPEQPARTANEPMLVFERPFVAPRDPTEAQLARIWRKLLGKSQISVKANFFELGGHSLTAARLLAQVEKALKKKLPLSVLFQAPTIEELAAVIRGQNAEATARVVNAIQPKGSKPPLFWVAGYARFIPLANCLGYDRPFLGLPLDSLRTLDAPYRTEDVAARLVKMIREVQPEGPYFLGGWCNAGLIAYEVAQQLEAQGQHVAFLVLIDAPNPSFSRRLSRPGAYDARLYFLGQKLQYHINAIRQLGIRGGYSYVLERLQTLRLRHKRKFYSLCYRLHLRAGLPLIAALKDPDEVAIIALSGYHPKPWSGRMTLVRNIARLAESYGSRKLGWDEYVSKLDVVECPGDHTDMFEGSNVAVLAQQLKACMANATESRPLPLPYRNGRTVDHQDNLASDLAS
jgi:thioesterase domain-containing protein/acyl carrier protein